MQTTAVRLYGPSDLRLETFSLPAIQPDEILVRVVCDSICMSTYKAVIQGSAHKRVPADIAENPIITGHEFCGEIVEVGPGGGLDAVGRHGWAPRTSSTQAGTASVAGP